MKIDIGNGKNQILLLEEGRARYKISMSAKVGWVTSLSVSEIIAKTNLPVSE
jgi:hypothetical protein